MKILQVKEYNKKAIEKWRERVKEWDYKKGGFPNLCFYTFSTPKGLHRQNGYVVFGNGKSCFGLNREKAIANFNKYNV